MRLSSDGMVLNFIESRDMATIALSDNSMGAHKLSTIGAALTLISTIVGGGIVGLPFAFYNLGLQYGLLFLLFMALQTVYSTKLYCGAKDLIPGKPESLFEIGFVLFGRGSIFLICGIIMFNSVGLMLVYLILFGGNFATLMINVSDPLTKDDFFGKQMAYVFGLGVLLIPVVIKKEL